MKASASSANFKMRKEKKADCTIFQNVIWLWTFGLSFWPVENPNVWECIYEPLGGSEMQGTIFGFRKTPKKVNFMLCTFATKTFKHLGRYMVFFNPQRAVLQWLDSFSFQVFQVIFCGMERGKRRRQKSQKKNINLDSSSRKRAHVDKMSLGNERSL